jgi:uncharacterized protein (TIGR04255 family)
MKKNKKYNNPPLVEVIFEVFYSSNSWSAIIPGLFYNEIKERFPNVSQNLGIGISLDGKGLKIGNGNGDLSQFKNEKNDSLIQLSNNILTIHKLPKYEGWDSYLETIEFVLKAFHKIIKPEKILRLGLKSLNKIDIKTASIEGLSNNIKIYPSIPETQHFNSNFNSLQLNFEFPINHNKELISIQIATLKKEPSYEVPVLLQIYILRTADFDLDFIEWLSNSHNILIETFENSLTNTCKKTFD